MKMATKETSIMEELRDLTECSICNRMISDPRGLPCIHTFCLECLENFESSSHRKPDDKMLCPVCRKEFTVPPEGMNGLQKNFFVERLAELMNISKPMGNVTGCDACNVGNRSTAETEAEASEYCIQCREKLCSRCSVEHLRNKFTRSHQVVQMGCDVTEFLTERHYSSVCDLHPEENTKMYCVDCKVVICMMCYAESHNTHKCMDVKKAVEKFQTDIEADIKKLTDFPKETLDRKEELEQEKKKFLKELKDAERMIKCKGKKLEDLVDKHSNDLLDDLSLVEQKRFKILDSRKEEVERHLESVDRFNTYCKEIISRGSPSDICRAVNVLHVRAEELQKLHEILIRQRAPSAIVSFKEFELEILLHAGNVIGEVKETEGTEKLVTTAKEKSRPSFPTVATWSAMVLMLLCAFWCDPSKNVSVSPVKQLNTLCDNVLSIASSQTAINVLCGDLQLLLIYENEYPFLLRTYVWLDFMTEPESVVGSPSSDSLFLTDSETDCIWIISRNGSTYLRTKWMCDDDLKMKSLSGDGSMILTTNQHFWKMKLYNLEYVHLLNSFDLPVDTYSRSAVRTSTGDFLVSCVSRAGYTQSICKFRNTGSLVPQCHTLMDSESNHLSLTSDDRVIVTDTFNNRIYLLNSDLSEDRVLLNGDKDSGIITLVSYNNERKLLVVGNAEGVIRVYSSDAIGL